MMIYILLAILFLVLYNTLKTKFKNLPPCPSMRVPILGHLPFLGNLPHVALKEWAKQYGDIMYIYFGPKPMVVLNTFDLIKECYSKEAFNNRVQPFVYLKHFQSKGLTFAHGDRWKTHRRFVQVTLRKLGMGHSAAEEIIMPQVKSLITKLKGSNLQKIDIRFPLNEHLANVISNLVLGYQFPENDPRLANLLNMLEEILNLSTHGSWLNAIPALRFVPIPQLGGIYKELNKNLGDLFKFATELVDEHEHPTLQSGAEPTDYINAFRLEKGSYFEKEQLVASLVSLLMGGTETSSATVRWAVVFMLENPSALEKVRQELESVDSEYVTWEHRHQLTYTEACLLEAQRLGSVSTLGGSTMRVTSESIAVRGYTIPKGTVIAANFYSVHMSEEYFPNPTEFNPNRFISEAGDIVIPAGYMAFGLGKRTCPGESLAKMQVFLFFSNLIKHLKFQPVDWNDIDSINKLTKGNVRAPIPYKMTFESRA